MAFPLALPLAGRAVGSVAANPAARAAVAPAIRTITGVSRDITAKVGSQKLMKGITIGSLATMAVDAVSDFFLDNPEETSAALKNVLKESGDKLSQQEAEAFVDMINAIEDVRTIPVVATEPDGSMLPGFALPTEADLDRKKAEQDYSSLRDVFSKRQIRALTMISQIATMPEAYKYLNYLESNYDES